MDPHSEALAPEDTQFILYTVQVGTSFINTDCISSVKTTKSLTENDSYDTLYYNLPNKN